MNLGVVGYLVSLSNLQAFGGPNSHVKDLSVQVADVATLANDLRNQPQFNIDNFRENGYYRIGNVGIYLSNNLRKYLFDNVHQDEEGTIITILFKESGDSSEEANFSHVLLRKHGLDEDRVHEVIDTYLNDYHVRNKA